MEHLRSPSGQRSSRQPVPGWNSTVLHTKGRMLSSKWKGLECKTSATFHILGAVAKKVLCASHKFRPCAQFLLPRKSSKQSPSLFSCEAQAGQKCLLLFHHYIFSQGWGHRGRSGSNTFTQLIIYLSVEKFYMPPISLTALRGLQRNHKNIHKNNIKTIRDIKHTLKQ